MREQWSHVASYEQIKLNPSSITRNHKIIIKSFLQDIKIEIDASKAQCTIRYVYDTWCLVMRHTPPHTATHYTTMIRCLVVCGRAASTRVRRRSRLLLHLSFKQILRRKRKIYNDQYRNSTAVWASYDLWSLALKYCILINSLTLVKEVVALRKGGSGITSSTIWIF